MENLGLLVLLGAGAYYLLNKNTGPIYRDINGRVITDIVCGGSITFDVPGYNRVWLSQLKNGQLIFDAPFDVPMPPYILNCQNETGQYEIAVYKLVSPGDIKGELIGQTTFTVLPGVIA
jgi:hypothetical protein